MTSFENLFADFCDSCSVQINSVAVSERRQQYGAWTRVTTIIEVSGAGFVGFGEDVCYEAIEHRHLQRFFAEIMHELKPIGDWRISELLNRFQGNKLFHKTARRAVNERYRRWAFESAILDLALQQNDVDFASVLNKRPEPLNFVASMRLPTKNPLQPIEVMLDRHEAIKFKLDADEFWDEELVDRLVALNAVRAVDFKGFGTVKSRLTASNSQLFELVAERLGDCWLEDPWLDSELETLRDRYKSRLAWDANVYSLEDLKQLSPSGAVNLKPSRLGSMAETLACIGYLNEANVPFYFGGQSELDIGRTQVQLLASMFCPQSDNDCAPKEWNLRPLPSSLPAPNLSVTAEPGFRARINAETHC